MEENKIVSNYNLEKLDDANIRRFLQLNNLSSNKYFFATQPIKITNTILFGTLSALTIGNYIVYFNTQSIYLFEMSKLSNKKIVNYFKIDTPNVVKVETEKDLLGIQKRLKIKLKDDTKLILEVNKRLRGIDDQLKNIEEFENMFNN